MDAQEFKNQYLPLYRMLYEDGLLLTGNVQDAEDLLQDFYLHLWKKRNTLPEDASLSYFLTIQRHIYAETQKRMRKVQFVSQKEIPTKVEMGPDISFEEREQEELALRMVDGLDAKERSILSMRVMEDKPYEEIGKETNLSQGAIRMIVMRARNKLKNRIARWNGILK